MEKISPREVVDTIVSVIVSSYGNLGYVSFKIHSITPNAKENVYIVKYSLIPRDKEDKRVFYKARINIKDKNIFETKEISETGLLEDDN